MAKAREDSDSVDLKIRMKEPLRAEVEKSARRKGISMNAEIISRLDKSYDRESLLDQVLELAYGRDLAGIITVLANEVSRRGRIAGVVSSGGGQQGLEDWVADPYAYAMAMAAAKEVLERFSPDGDPSILRNGSRVSDLSDHLHHATDQAKETMGFIKDPDWARHRPTRERNLEFEGWAAGRRSRLGPLADRIRMDQKENDMTSQCPQVRRPPQVSNK